MICSECFQEMDFEGVGIDPKTYDTVVRYSCKACGHAHGASVFDPPVRRTLNEIIASMRQRHGLSIEEQGVVRECCERMADALHIESEAFARAIKGVLDIAPRRQEEHA